MAAGEAPETGRTAAPSSAVFLDDIRGGLSWVELLIPAALVTLLCIPCVGLSYLWDDYAFLDNALRLRLWDFLPDPSDPFYRPISRGVYFTILSAARESGELIGHGVNLAVLAVITMLITGLGARFGGRRVGICSGMSFAGLACLPTLVAWVCCSQDLFAMLLVCLALHARLSGRRTAAWICLAIGVLCKETALAALPAVLLADWARGGSLKHFRREALAYLLLVAGWMAIHPGIQILLGRGFRPGSTGYVGLGRAFDILRQGVWYLLELCNLRIGKLLVTWTPAETAGLVASAIAAAVGTFILLRRGPGQTQSGRPALVIGAILAAGPFVLTSAIILGWGHYYAAFLGLGSSLLLGSLLARWPRWAVAVSIALFLLIGLWSRSSDLKNDFVTENNLRISSAAHRKFRTSMLKLLPTVQPGSQILLSVQAAGRARVYHQVYFYQMPSIWYRDPTVVSRKPEDRKATASPDILFAVLPNLDVIRIDPSTFQVTSASGIPPHYIGVEQALRTYAMGLWGSGETDAGARLLVEMPEIDRNWESMHHRMAVAMLQADGRMDDARRLMAGIPPASRAWALRNLRAILAQQPKHRNFDAAALSAFGFDSTDTGALSELSRWLLKWRYYEPAGRLGERILTVVPGDTLGLRAVTARDSVRAVFARVRIRGE